MRFSNFYAPSPRCTPSRAAFFTGRSPAALHMTFVGIGGEETNVTGSLVTPATVTDLPTTLPTIASLLKAAGYATAHYGKWHVGRSNPTAYGFDDSDAPTTPALANTWHGAFPVRDVGEDGYAGTAPVGRYPANGYGLVDMAGNVWEWTASNAAPDQRVVRGGSFLCHASYCEGYRVAATMSATPATTLQNTGFRCAAAPAGRATSPAPAAPAARP